MTKHFSAARMVRVSSALVTLMLIAGCSNEPVVPFSPDSFSFGLIGDVQYNSAEERQFPALLRAIDAEPLAFVVHVGDFKAGGNSPCTDALFATRLAEFEQSRHPLIYLPGDNEWVDCRRPTNGAMDPLDRLRKLRELFFREPKSLGRSKLALTVQADVSASDPVLSRYRENVMWVHQGVVFVTLNVQGSNDNVGFDTANDAEQRERTRANIQWLGVAVKRAKADDVVGLAVISHANPGFEDTPADVAKSGYVAFLKEFEAEAEKFGKPVLFAHGDSHRHRIDRPYVSPVDKRALKNVTRVEGYGSPNVNWVRVSVDPNKPSAPFIIASGNFLPIE